MLGSFPPPHRRWCFDFFYPNFSNQMWQVFGLVFYGDAMRLVDSEHKTFRLEDIKALLSERGIAIYDTACAVRRLSGNASDKDLEIVEKTDIPLLLSKIPLCHDIVCTGQKSFSVLTEDYGVPVPMMGEYNEFIINTRNLRLWRMPSTSRAYPMPLDQKAHHYRNMMQQTGILESENEKLKQRKAHPDASRHPSKEGKAAAGQFSPPLEGCPQGGVG